MRKFWLLFSILIPCSIIGAWHFSNNGYPSVDDSVYFETTQHIQQAFQEEGVSGALKSAYFERSLKPIIHPVLAVPLLIMMGGKVLPTVACTGIIFYAFLLFFIFRLFEIFLSPSLSALGTIAIGLIPWLMDRAFTFNSEIFWLLCVAASAFYLFKIYKNKNLKSGFALGMWLGLGICARPVEMALLFFWPILALIFSEYKNKNIKKFQLAAFLLECFSFVAFLFWQWHFDIAPQNVPLWPAFFLILLVAGVTSFNSLSLALGICYSGVLLWFFPFGKNLVDWIALGSLSQITLETGHKAGASYFQFLASSVITICGLPFLFFLLLWLFSGFEQKLSWRKCAAIAFCLLFPLLVGALSYNSTLRYYYGSGMLAYFFVAVGALKKEGRWFSFRIVAVSFLVCALIFGNIFYMTNPNAQLKMISLIKPEPPLRGQDPAKQFCSDLKSLLPMKKLSVAIVPYSLDLDDLVVTTADPWLLTIIAREAHWPWFFERPNVGRPGHSSTDLSFYLKNYDFILVGPLEGSPSGDRDFKVAQKIIEENSKNNLDAIGLVKEGFVHAFDRVGRSGTFVLMKTIAGIKK
jgi:hypothetical protein